MLYVLKNEQFSRDKGLSLISRHDIRYVLYISLLFQRAMAIHFFIPDTGNLRHHDYDYICYLFSSKLFSS